jgi:hypothetical protein
VTHLEAAEALFKRKHAEREQDAMAQYRERQEAERRNTERLRALRLAKENEIRPKAVNLEPQGAFVSPAAVTLLARAVPSYRTKATHMTVMRLNASVTQSNQKGPRLRSGPRKSACIASPS